MRGTFLSFGAGIAVAVFMVSSSAQSNDTRHSLLQAIQRGDTASVSRLIEDRTSPNVKDDDGVPALILAALFTDAACVELLLKRGAVPIRVIAAERQR